MIIYIIIPANAMAAVHPIEPKNGPYRGRSSHGIKPASDMVDCGNVLKKKVDNGNSLMKNSIYPYEISLCKLCVLKQERNISCKYRKIDV